MAEWLFMVSLLLWLRYCRYGVVLLTKNRPYYLYYLAIIIISYCYIRKFDVMMALEERS